MSKRADTITLRLAKPEEHQKLEDLQRRASLELPEYRDDLLANPDAIHLPPAQIANGQVIVADFAGEVAGFAAVVGGELDGLFVEPDLWGGGIGRALIQAAAHQARLRGLTGQRRSNSIELERLLDRGERDTADSNLVDV